jgi:hypothetical protein
VKTCVNARARIRLVLILCAAPLAWAGEASADPATAAQSAAVEGLAPHEILAMVRASGFDPVGRPVRNGRTFTLRAFDRYDLELNLVVEARSGRVLSANEIAAPRDAARRGTMPAYDPRDAAPVYGRIFGPPEAGFGSPRPPRNVPGAPSVQSAPATPSVANVKPQEKAAARPPLPRPRPYVAEATGSVPVAADPPAMQADTASPTEAVQKSNGGASMPPVAPLD